MVRRLVLIISIITALVLSIVSCYTTPTPTQDSERVPTETRSINENPQYIYEDGAIHVGGDGKPIELINNSDATNPTYAELVAFLKEDSTDEHSYIEEFSVLSYVCSDFAEDVHNNAEAAGIRAAWVSIKFKGEEIGHALNAFETTNRGLVYVDCTGGNVGGVECLKEIMKDSSDTVPLPQPESWDSIAYVEIDREYGLIYLDVASSLSYIFYEEYKWKWQEHDRLVSVFNDDVEQFNQEIEEKGILEGSPEALRIDAWEARLEEQEKVIEELAEEYDRLLSDYNDDVDQFNQEIEEKGILEGSPEALRVEAWEARLEEQEKVIDELAKEIGEFSAKPLGIVRRIEIYW